jgi:putative redox protein
MHEVVIRAHQNEPLAQELIVGSHVVVVDEPADVGGHDLGPSPPELLLGSLGACTAMTVRMYAARKQWPLEDLTVRVTGEKREDGFHMALAIELEGPLSAEQRARMIEIGERCPMRRLLTGPIIVEDRPAQT